MRRCLRIFPLALLPGLLGLLISCGSPRPHLQPEGPQWKEADDRNIPEPASSDPSLVWQTIDRTVFTQAEQLVDIERDLRILAGDRAEAWNINAADEVPDCSWFTNRIGRHSISPQDIAAGVNATGGPDTTGVWILSRPKVGGKTPGFWIEDHRGNKYIIKFDPIENPELATAAAAMGSRYFHSAGYNVPEETIVYWRPEQLHIKEGLTFTDRRGVRRAFTDDDLRAILGEVRHEPDGRIRSVAWRALPNVKGPFSYSGRRNDDPNDWCPHEHRRELRGLYVVASLINHYDTKDQNTLDCYVEEDGRRFLRHYLIDFGSTFGSNGDRPKEPAVGYTNGFDLRDSFVSLITLGLKIWPWERAKPYQYPSIGYFESELFEPHKFDPIAPNPAFENMTARDAFWGAKIVMAFRDEHLQALVDAGQYSDPEAAAYLLKTLKERREKIGRHWFSKVNPLDGFDLTQDSDGLTIRFRDLAVEYGFESEEETKYRFEVRYDSGTQVEIDGVFRGNVLRLNRPIVQEVAKAVQRSAQRETKDFVTRVDVKTSRGDGKWSRPARLWLWYFPEQQDWRLVGVEHVD